MQTTNEEFQIKRLEMQDLSIFQNLVALFQEVFETEYPETCKESYLKNLLEDTHFIAFVAIKDHEVIGGFTAYELPMYYSEYSEVFIYDIAVKAAFQKKGVGRKLLSVLNRYCNEKGIKEFFVEAHAEDQHAVDFYKSTGGIAENVVHFNYLVNNKI